MLAIMAKYYKFFINIIEDIFRVIWSFLYTIRFVAFGFFITIITCGFCLFPIWMDVYEHYLNEIDSDKYVTIQTIIKTYPQIKIIVNEYMDDDVITKYEFEKINSLYSEYKYDEMKAYSYKNTEKEKNKLKGVLK